MAAESQEVFRELFDILLVARGSPLGLRGRVGQHTFHVRDIDVLRRLALLTAIARPRHEFNARRCLRVPTQAWPAHPQ